MQAIAEISMYPLSREYDGPIIDFIGRINQYDSLEIQVGETSTVIRGEYGHLMDILVREMEHSLATTGRAVFVLKVLNMG